MPAAVSTGWCEWADKPAFWFSLIVLAVTQGLLAFPSPYAKLQWPISTASVVTARYPWALSA